MNCSESRIAISQLTGQENLPADLAGHLSACELCQQVYTDFLLHRELTELQVPEPETDFLVNALKYAATESEQAVTRRYS
ncbi:MAG: hypothetical protein WD601_01380, partial [Pseudohongiellaceae bacterium]